MAKVNKEIVIRSSGNVFADLDFENSQDEIAKADLVISIGKIIRSRKLTQKRVAEEIGIDQPQVSRLLKGHTEGFSIERLMRFLERLGHRVEIMVLPAPVDRSDKQTKRKLPIRSNYKSSHAVAASAKPKLRKGKLAKGHPRAGKKEPVAL